MLVVYWEFSSTDKILENNITIVSMYKIFVENETIPGFLGGFTVYRGPGGGSRFTPKILKYQ